MSLRIFRVTPHTARSAPVWIKASYFEIDALGVSFFDNEAPDSDERLIGFFAHACDVVELAEEAA